MTISDKISIYPLANHHFFDYDVDNMNDLQPHFMTCEICAQMWFKRSAGGNFHIITEKVCPTFALEMKEMRHPNRLFVLKDKMLCSDQWERVGSVFLQFNLLNIPASEKRIIETNRICQIVSFAPESETSQYMDLRDKVAANICHTQLDILPEAYYRFAVGYLKAPHATDKLTVSQNENIREAWGFIKYNGWAKFIADYKAFIVWFDMGFAKVKLKEAPKTPKVK